MSALCQWSLMTLAQKHNWDKGKKWLYIGDLGLTLNIKFWPIKACLHTISWTKRWIQTKFHVLYHLDSKKIWLDFGDLDPFFEVTTLLGL